MEYAAQCTVNRMTAHIRESVRDGTNMIARSAIGLNRILSLSLMHPPLELRSSIVRPEVCLPDANNIDCAGTQLTAFENLRDLCLALHIVKCLI